MKLGKYFVEDVDKHENMKDSNWWKLKFDEFKFR